MSKKFLSAALAALLALGAACSASPGVPAATPAAQAAGPKVIDVTTCLFIGDASDYPEIKAQYAAAFQEKTGYQLNLTVLAREEYISKLNLLALSGTLTGMVRTFSLTDLIRFKNDGAIDPLGTIRGNAAWQALPQDARELYEFDGEIWGVPMGYVRNMFARAYRKDWLDNLGLALPNTVDEFYAVMDAFTHKDPDQNGQDDTFGFTSSSTWTMQDVFQAFDARLDNTGGGSIAYDPLLGYFTDSMVKPEMAEALAFLRKCYAEGLLDPETFTNGGAAMRERMWAGRAGSIFYWSHWPSQSVDQFTAQNPKAEIVLSLGLTGKRAEKTNFVSIPTNPPYVLAKGTPNGDQMAEYFMDAFVGSPDGHEMARFGIEGVTYRREGDLRVVLRDPATGAPYPGPTLVNEYPQYNSIKMPYANDGTPAEIAASLELMQKNTLYVLNAMNDPRIFVVQYDIILSDAYSRLSSDISMAFKECIATSVTGEAEIQTAIQTYIDTLRAIGAAEVINECNANFGLDAPQFAY